METKEQIIAYCKKIRTAGMSAHLDQLVRDAETSATGYMEFTLSLLQAEAEHRHQNEVIRRRIKQPAYQALTTLINMITPSIMECLKHA